MLYSELQEDFYETYCQTSGRCRWDPRPGWSLHPDEPPWHESLYLHRGHKAPKHFQKPEGLVFLKSK